MAITQTQLNNHIAYIQQLHADQAEDYCNALQYGSRGISALEKNNLLLSQYIETLYRQNLNDTSNNTLVVSQMEVIINDCYRRTLKYQ